jgi:hypothetical protein
MHSGIWVDQCFASASGDTSQLEAIAAARQRSHFNGVYFGGIGFKHQPALVERQDDATLLPSSRHYLTKIAGVASRYVDVLITSGGRTGERPSHAKCAAMQASLHRRAPFATSGCGMELSQFSDVCDVFLGATSLQRVCDVHGARDSCVGSFCRFDCERLRAWAALRPSSTVRAERVADDVDGRWRRRLPSNDDDTDDDDDRNNNDNDDCDVKNNNIDNDNDDNNNNNDDV